MSRNSRVRIGSSIFALTLSLSLPGRSLAEEVTAQNAANDARRKQVVAKVEGVEITVGRVEDFLATQPPMMRERYRQAEERKSLIENMVRMELLAAEATRRAYDKNPAVVRTVKDSAVQALLRADVDSKYSPQSVPAEDIKAYYDANPQEFHRAATRRASQIVLATEAEAKKLLAEAQKADMRGFTELAKQHSKDAETKLRGGDLGYFGKEAVPGGSDGNVAPAVRNAAFGLKNSGDTASQPVAVEGGFAIVRLTGERPERHTDLAEADGSIRAKLWRERRQRALDELLTGLRARDKTQVFAERAELVKFDDMEKRPGGFDPERVGPGAPKPMQPTPPHP
jgi:peptidyl-prolyl cis-trans isomerase C